MKLLEKKITSAILHAAKKRAIRKVVFNGNKNSTIKSRRNGRKRNHIEIAKIVAPSILDLYKASYHDATVDFIKKIEKKASEGTLLKTVKIHICFRNTSYITAAAGLWLLSKIEFMRSLSPYAKFTVTRPPAAPTRGFKKNQPVVDSVLNRIGFYTALGLERRSMAEISNVKCWEVTRGEQVVGSKIGELLSSIMEKTGTDYSSLYRPLIEAMSNSVEHAYRADLYKKKGNPTKWWCFAAILNNSLTVLICDLGVGIPNTLHKTQNSQFIKRIIEILGRPLSSDADYIKAALQVKKTRTELDYRGKGGTDLQSVIETTQHSKLCIMSNRGYYQYTNRGSRRTPEVMFDNKLSIGGTIVQWSVELPSAENAK
ncbi:hypothetical protein [Serratia marcescens]|uniref:hypothetical protein n=1 Tax=Serratia marcescens TaxID=615 RepID=UPI00237F98A2|nr:hypothetical protein [Serratia marcescens]